MNSLYEEQNVYLLIYSTYCFLCLEQYNYFFCWIGYRFIDFICVFIGLTGAPGYRGRDGLKGRQGLIGLRGEQGSDGNQGEQGDNGFIGRIGIKGDAGKQ